MVSFFWLYLRWCQAVERNVQLLDPSASSSLLCPFYLNGRSVFFRLWTKVFSQVTPGRKMWGEGPLPGTEAREGGKEAQKGASGGQSASRHLFYFSVPFFWLGFLRNREQRSNRATFRSPGHSRSFFGTSYCRGIELKSPATSASASDF